MAVEMVQSRTLPRFASAADFEECRLLHRKHGTTYYLASRLFPLGPRQRTDALYGFVRLPDEWVDNPTESVESVRSRLHGYRAEFMDGLKGIRPSCGVLRAFCDVALAKGIPSDVPLSFLDSMEQDLDKSRYETYEELRGYMRGSASAVGVMMCFLLSDLFDANALPHASALGEAMQMTTFLRDIGEDAERGRIYLPQEDMRRFGVDDEQIFAGRLTGEFKDLMRFEMARTQELYNFANQGIDYLPPYARKAVRVASILYRRILDRIVGAEFDVFTHRARTSRTEKLIVASQVLCGGRP